MKKLIYLFLMTITNLCLAQTPNKMSYQAVIRDAGSQLVTNTQVGMQISILQGSANGVEVYIETQTPTSNQNGLISIEIGNGTVVSGDINTINWSTDTYFIKTETDITGGSNYTISGTSQMLSVPYALHAKTASTVVNPILMEPYILGRSTQTSNGRFIFNGKTGWQAANEMCKASYPDEPYARAFTVAQITEAITIESYSDNTNYDGISFWAITSSVTKGNSFNNGSAPNNSYNLGHNSGDLSIGTRGTIIFNYTTPGNGGGITLPRFFNVQQEISSGTNYPCLCGTYKPAE